MGWPYQFDPPSAQVPKERPSILSAKELLEKRVALTRCHFTLPSPPHWLPGQAEHFSAWRRISWSMVLSVFDLLDNGLNLFFYATTPSSHPLAASGPRVSHLGLTDGSRARLVPSPTGGQELIACAFALQYPSGSLGRGLLVSAGGIQCGCSQVEATAARFTGPFDSTKFGRDLHPHQSAKPINLHPNRMKKALSFKDQGLDDGAACRIRTDDLPLTRRVLYQLS
jgi:hypothetical protein